MDKITQADRHRAEQFNCDLRCGMTGTQVHNLAGAFAEHRLLATRTDATPVAEVEALRGSISIMETALQQIAGTHVERFGRCQTDVEEVPDLSAEEAVSIARNALEATGGSHPPATDVAALVEAAKTFQHYGCPICSGDCGSANPPVMACPMQALSAALAPFTKGQNDG